MSKKKDITIVPEPIKNPAPRNFWNTCPRKLELLPETPCNRGKKSALTGNEDTACGGCPWAVKDADSNYCFWKWVNDRSAPDGYMEPGKQDDVAALLNCSSTRVHLTCKDALRSIKRGSLANVLAELNKSTQPDPDESADAPLVGETPPNSDDGNY